MMISFNMMTLNNINVMKVDGLKVILKGLRGSGETKFRNFHMGGPGRRKAGFWGVKI